MEFILLLLFAFILGAFAAVPIGGSQIEVLKRAVTGQLTAARFVTGGTSVADVTYGILSLFGMSQWIDLKSIMPYFSLFACLLLWILAWITFKESKKPHGEILVKSLEKRGNWKAFLTGLGLSAANPSMMVTWFLGFALAQKIGICSDTFNSKIVFILGGASGLAAYPVTLSGLVAKHREYLPTRHVPKIYKTMSAILLISSLYFFSKAVPFFQSLLSSNA